MRADGLGYFVCRENSGSWAAYKDVDMTGRDYISDWILNNAPLNNLNLGCFFFKSIAC